MPGYSASKRTCDLRRVRRKGLLRRSPRSQRERRGADGRLLADLDVLEDDCRGSDVASAPADDPPRDGFRDPAPHRRVTDEGCPRAAEHVFLAERPGSNDGVVLDPRPIPDLRAVGKTEPPPIMTASPRAAVSRISTWSPR